MLLVLFILHLVIYSSLVSYPVVIYTFVLCCFCFVFTTPSYFVVVIYSCSYLCDSTPFCLLHLCPHLYLLLDYYSPTFCSVVDSFTVVIIICTQLHTFTPVYLFSLYTVYLHLFVFYIVYLLLLVYFVSVLFTFYLLLLYYLLFYFTPVVLIYLQLVIYFICYSCPSYLLFSYLQFYLLPVFVTRFYLLFCWIAVDSPDLILPVILRLTFTPDCLHCDYFTPCC